MRARTSLASDRPFGDLDSLEDRFTPPLDTPYSSASLLPESPVSALPYQQIKALILHGSPPLATGYRDLEAQVQPNGLDLSLNSVRCFLGPGELGLTNAERRLPASELVPFDAGGMVHLPPGPYVATLNEVLHLPESIMALGRPRSSLLRSGVAVHNAVWDAGYYGQSQVLMVVYNPHGFSVARDARILQLVFFTLESATTAPYTGLFRGEGL